MKSILVVSYHFPPEEGSCSDKNIRIVRLLIESGYRVVVLTKSGFWPSSMQNLEIIRTNSNGFFHKKANLANCNQNGKIRMSSSLKKKLSLSIIPDAVIDWFPCVQIAYKENYDKIADCDVILSISSPYSAHIISYWLSKKMRKPFVMCYGDPWLYENKRGKNKLRYFIEKQLEGYLLRRCSKILLITEWNKSKYMELYNISSDKISTYHIGYDKEDRLDTNAIPNKEIHIVYGGSLDAVHRSPAPLLEAMNSVEDVKVLIYSNDNPEVPKLVKKLKIEDKVFVNDIIPSEEFNKKMYENDALLLFGNKTPYQVPGKVFTYISTGKLILYIKNNPYKDDGTEMLLRKYNNSIIVNNNTDEIRTMLCNLKEYISSPRESFPNEFEYHITMQPIVQSIKEIVDE